MNLDFLKFPLNDQERVTAFHIARVKRQIEATRCRFQGRDHRRPGRCGCG